MKQRSRNSAGGGRVIKSRSNSFSPTSVFENIVAFVRFMRDRRAPVLGKALVLTAIAYVVMPVDAVPDIAPLIGWLDDMGVAMIALVYLSRVLGPYRQVSVEGDDEATATVATDRAYPSS